MTTSWIFSVEEDGRLLPRGSDLTDEQLAALDLDHHVMVTAGAGSGKTRTLGRRVLRILGEFAWRVATGDGNESPRGPRNLLVSTFTERAAAELQERIREELLLGIRELQARIGEFEADPRLEAGVSDAVLCQLRCFHRDLDQARIGTFHGFCATTLKEFAASLGLDPGFSILRGPEHDRLLDESVEQTLTALEATSARSDGLASGPYADCSALFRSFGRRRIFELLQSWLKRRSELQPFAQVLDQHSDDELIDRWLECYGQADPSTLEAAIAPGSAIHQQLADIAALEPYYTGPEDQCPPILKSANDALQIAANAPASATVHRTRRLQEYLCLFTKADGALRNIHYTWTGRKNDLGKDRAAALADLWAPLRTQLGSLFGEQGEFLATIPGPADEAGLPVLRALAGLAEEATSRYQDRKKQDALLDFTDLEVEVLRLLREHPRERARLQRRFEHQLVDEFQDTNATQWNIVKLLAGDPLPKRGMFLVGDPKQAIYRFRGGDVTLFDRAIEELGGAGGRVLRFSANFRSRPNLITTFNNLFGWLMPGEEPDRLPWEAPFTELAAGRVVDEGADDQGLVEMLWLSADDSKPTSRDETQDTPSSMAFNPALAATMPLGREAALVAAQLRDRHLSEVTPHKGIKAAILLRRRTHLPAYAFALRQAGVPHVVARGRGFFARQEVLDVANLLLALSHPDDVIALIGALRGPFLGLEDAWLLWLARIGAAAGPHAVQRGWGLCLGSLTRPQPEAPDGWQDLPAEGQQAISAAAEQFSRWQQLRHRLPLSAFLREVLFASGAFHLFTLGDPSGQARANVEKLLSLAAGYDERGTEGLANFALFLRDQEEAQTDEGEASIDATAPVVIMTIHQSKGLEFPIVVLPDLQQAVCRTESAHLACSRLGAHWRGDELWEVGLGVPIETDRRVMEPMVLRKLIQQRSRQEDLAESRRLLYVAMTRARDRLICVSRAPRKSADPPRGLEDSTTWEEWLRSWLSECDAPTVTVQTEMQVADERGDDAERAQEPTGALPTADELGPLPQCTTTVVTPHSLTAQPFSPRQVGADRGSAPTDRAQLGKMRGLLVHSCLEDGLYRPGEATERRINYELAKAGLLTEEHADWLREELSRHLHGFLSAAPPEMFVDDQSGVFRELSFRLQLPGPTQPGLEGGAHDGVTANEGWLVGVIDLLFRDPGSRRWIVLDYKSDGESPVALAQKYRGQLLAYAWAASTILPELSEPGWAVETQLLCTAHGERRTIAGPSGKGEIEAQFRALLQTD